MAKTSNNHPRDTSAAGIAASIERMESALIELRGEFAALQGARRGVVLAAASAAEVAAHDDKLRALAIDIERAEAAVDALRPELATARGRERIARIEQLCAAAEEAAGKFRKFWSGEYEQLARAIAAGLDLERLAKIALSEAQAAIVAAHRSGDVQAAGGLLKYDLPQLPRAFVNRGVEKTPGLLVCLPAVEPGPPIAWPSGHYLAQALPAGEATAYARN